MSAQNNNLNNEQGQNLYSWERRLRKELQELRVNIDNWSRTRSTRSPVKEPRQASIMELDPYLANAENQNYDDVNFAKLRHFLVKSRGKRNAVTCRRHRIDNSSCRRSKLYKHKMKKLQMDEKISELIAQMPKVNITDNSAIDSNIITGISRLSCYDKNPRQPALNMEDGNSLDSNPDLTQKLGAIHFGPSSTNDYERTVQSSSICESIRDLKIEEKPFILPDEIYDIGLGKWKL